jgi:phosphate transport system permease protein
MRDRDAAPYQLPATERSRVIADLVMRGLCGAAAVAGAGMLLWLFIHVVVNGASAISLDLFTQLPAPLGLSGGGIAHAIVGSLIIVGMACVVGVPLGIGAGIYLAEYAGTRT